MLERDEAAMKEGIENAEKVLVIMSESYFKHEFCLKELRWARDAEKDVVVCIDVSDKQRIGEFRTHCPQDLLSIFSINFIELNTGDVDYWNLGLQKLLKAPCKKLLKNTEVETEDREHSAAVLCVRVFRGWRPQNSVAVIGVCSCV